MPLSAYHEALLPVCSRPQSDRAPGIVPQGTPHTQLSSQRHERHRPASHIVSDRSPDAAHLIMPSWPAKIQGEQGFFSVEIIVSAIPAIARNVSRASRRQRDGSSQWGGAEQFRQPATLATVVRHSIAIPASLTARRNIAYTRGPWSTTPV